jgi:hypothetical protein
VHSAETEVGAGQNQLIQSLFEEILNLTG